ncbi:hypothetical protein RS130_07670 [Paraglaciecola aquimarina]|uniref:TPR repeat-containing protein n=1 Tax=Paraglaciecola aquimarina TaxID=1235557 RepID=A0ABU3SUX2_9ALTE|nr:hypothetical protein [Paraglaciecola aquimarina]MDU0353820.1 hypothetical protein [Paraglaciecola aquimarina]
MNTYIFHIDETTYDENLLDLYCEKISSLEMFDIPILRPTQTIEAYKKRLKSKRVKLPVVMAFELTKSKAIIQTLWNESSNIRSDNAKQIYLFTILLNKRDIWISDEFYSSIYDTIHYKNIVDQHLLGLLVPAKGALYVRDKPIAKILISHIFSCFEEEIRFIRDYLKQNLELVKTDRTKTQMSRQLSEIAYRLMANTRNAEIIVEYIGDIFHSIERFINVPDFRAMLYNKVATFLIANGKEKQGIEIYYLGIKNVESDHFYMQLARFYLHEKNNEEKALKYLKNCIKKGTNAIVITEYCKQLVDVGSINKALKIYRKTVNEFPDDPGIFTSYAMLLSRENRIEEALSVFQQGSLGKPDTQLYTAWIKTLLKAKQEQLALEIFYEAKANIEPESGIYTIVASYYFRHNKLMLAESMCEEGLRFNPTAHHIAITCRVLRRLQKTDRAHEVLNKYTKHNDTYLITERFLLHYDLQQYSLCLQTILTTKINVLKDTDYLYFANKLYKQKQYQQVVLICQKALELQKRPRLFLLCAQALEAQDKPLRAIECMIEGLCLDDKNESILRALSTSFTDKNTATVIDMLKHRLNLKSLLYNSAFVTLLISTQAKHNCLPTIYNKIKILLNDEMRNLFKAELTSENDAKSAK